MQPPYIIFCADPLAPKTPDQAFSREIECASALGFPRLLIDHDALDRSNDAAASVKRIRETAPGAAIYRGWMLTAPAYAALFEALQTRGLRLINTPEQYQACHYTPEAQRSVGNYTAKTRWLERDFIADDAALQQTLAPFDGAPVVLKDWVKSQAAGYWNEACFIPNSSDLASVKTIVARFLELQGDAFVGGLVFSAFTEFSRVGGEVEEWRAFMLEGDFFGPWPRFSGPSGAEPPAELVREVAAAIPSRFATADFARRSDSAWQLIEIGDGQVSGFPDRADPEVVFTALHKIAAS